MILAGEASGDAHGARVAAEILRRWPRSELVGLGGERMAAAGVRLLFGLQDLSVMGFAEVVRRLGFFRRLERTLRRLLGSGDFDIVVPVDYPGLNLRIARHAARLGTPVLYYIGPQVWAWRARRAQRLARIADGIAVILPFEPELYAAHGGRAVFVGHPLLDEAPKCDAKGLADDLGLDPKMPVLALFPGSREQELERHGAPFAAIARDLQRRVPGLQVVVSRVSFLPDAAYRTLPFPSTTDGHSLRALATAGLVKSGTGTLEAALAEMPFAVAYVTHPLTYFLARRWVRVPYVALANLVAGRVVAPEFVQHDVTTAAVADALEPLLADSGARRAAAAGLAEVRGALGAPGAARRVVDMMSAIVGESAAGGRGLAPTRTA